MHNRTQHPSQLKPPFTPKQFLVIIICDSTSCHNLMSKPPGMRQLPPGSIPPHGLVYLPWAFCVLLAAGTLSSVYARCTGLPYSWERTLGCRNLTSPRTGKISHLRREISLGRTSSLPSRQGELGLRLEFLLFLGEGRGARRGMRCMGATEVCAEDVSTTT